MKTLHKLLLFVLSLFLSNAQAQTLDMKFWKKNDSTLIAFGMITEQSLNALKKEDLQNIKELIVTSSGGEVHAAAEIGLIIFEHNIKVIVSDYCFSACANWIFLPAKQKALLSNAALGFHADITSQFDLVRTELRISHGDPEKNPFLMGEKSAKSLFAKARISPTIYREIASKTSFSPPSIIMSVKTEQGQVEEYELTGNEENDSNLYSKYEKAKVISYRWKGRIENAYWFPSKSELMAFNVSGIQEYYFPANFKEVENLEKTYGIHLIGEWEK